MLPNIGTAALLSSVIFGTEPVGYESVDSQKHEPSDTEAQSLCISHAVWDPNHRCLQEQTTKD